MPVIGNLASDHAPPLRGLRIVLWNTLPPGVERAQVGLGVWIALIRRLLIPRGGLGMILGNAMTKVVCKSKDELGADIALFR